MDRDGRVNLLVNPSLLLNEKALDQLEHRLGHLRKYFRFYHPKSLEKIIADYGQNINDVRWFVPQGRIAPPAVVANMLETFKSTSFSATEEHFSPERERLWQIEETDDGRSERDVVRYVSNNLLKDLQARPIVADCLVEEYQFLQSMSWSAGRSKKVLDALQKAGVSTLRIGDRLITHAARRQLGVPDTDFLTQSEKLRGIAKWVGQGSLTVGGAALGTIFGTAGAAAGLAGSGYLAKSIVRWIDP